jgi:Bacterial Ig-like domain (group 3)/Putative Ig domain
MLLAGAGPAAAASCPAATDTTVTFCYTGSAQSWTVPAGVTEATITLYGAEGASSSSTAAGGYGAKVTGTVSVTPGAALQVDVGGTGSVSQQGGTGGFGGGGNGANSAGGGGGASYVVSPNGTGSYPFTSALLVAAGGGGGGENSTDTTSPPAGGPGGNAGSAGGDGGSTTGSCGETLTGGGGGQPGTSTAGGAGGAAGTASNSCAATANAGANGSSGTGGAGGVIGGGGGGGGWYGGGGGGGAIFDEDFYFSAGGGGGGGSSYTGDATDSSVSVDSGTSPDDGVNGEVIISFTYPLTITTSALPSGTPNSPYSASLAASAGTSPYRWSLLSGSLPAGLNITASGVISGTPTTAGTYAFTVQVADSSTPQETASAGLSITILGTPQVTLSASPAAGNATTATPVALTASVAGVTGVAAPTGSVTFGGSAAACGTVTLTAGTASCALGDLAAGSYSFTASYSGDANYTAGPTASLTGYPVSLAGQTVTFTSGPPATPEYGGSYTEAASATSGLPVSFSVGPTSTAGACTVAASTGVVSFTGTGTCVIDANQAGNSQYAAATAAQSFIVAPATTTTTVAVSATALTTTVTSVPPGGGTPSGTVTFTVNGSTVGTATLTASGTATLPYASSGAATVAAAYAGNADYLASSASTATRNPVITAAVSSKYSKSKYGWYRSPVTVSFTCTAGSSPLSGSCPGPVTLTKNGADQVVTKTIHDTDGGIATVAVTVSIDQTKPTVSVTGIKNKASYDAPGPAKITCKASETISGLAAPCKLTVKRTETAITWTATAASKAGLTTTVTGKASLTDFYVAGAKLVHGRYVVTAGKKFTLEAYLLGTSKAPKYTGAARAPARPGKTGPAMKKTGPSRWAVAITIGARSKTGSWTLGILVGRTLHLVQITLQR